MALIRTEGLSRAFALRSGVVKALDGIDLEIETGEFVAIMGPSGSGKSTLMHVLGLLDRPSRGRYVFEDRDVASIGLDEQARLRGRRIGFVFQAFNLLPRQTARENVELPLIYSRVSRRKRRERSAAALDAVGLRHRHDHWPHQLSGGEQQRVAIARALVNEPAIVFADEPTGSLDTQTGADILAMLGELHRRGRTMVLVTHDPTVARHAERTIHLRDGRIVDQGSPAAAAPA
jgi:putative ABC transport system ATP-binding protein